LKLIQNLQSPREARDFAPEGSRTPRDQTMSLSVALSENPLPKPKNDE
jgi:hypothetical protein